MDEKKTYLWLRGCKWYLIYFSLAMLISFIRNCAMPTEGIPLSRLLSQFLEKMLPEYPDLAHWKFVLFGVLALYVDPLVTLYAAAVCFLGRERASMWALLVGCAMAALFVLAVEHALSAAFFSRHGIISPLHYLARALVLCIGLYFRKVERWRNGQRAAVASGLT